LEKIEKLQKKKTILKIRTKSLLFVGRVEVQVRSKNSKT